MSTVTRSHAEEQKAEFETRRKLDMVVEWLEAQVRMKRQAVMFGRLVVEFIFEKGYLKRTKIVDETTIDDLSDREREAILTKNAG